MSSEPKFRVLHVLNHIRNTGNGIVNLTVDIACIQARLGYPVAIASTGGDYESLLKQSGVQHFHLNQSRTVTNLPKMWQRYDHIISTFEPDVVHTHMMTGVLLTWIYRQYEKVRGSTTYSFIATVHNEFQRNAILMGLADRVIAISQAVKQAMNKRGVPSAKIRVVLNGSLGSPRQSLAKHDQAKALNKPALLTVAGLYKRKGISELIEAFAKIASEFPDAHLYIVGDGPDRTRFEQEAQTTGVSDRIHFEGFQSNPQQYMCQADIFVLASHQEPFGLVLSEARASGCAIVASDVDGIPEALDGGEAGILVPPKDSDALAKSLSNLLNNQREVSDYQRRSKVNLERFRVERVAKETIAVYSEALNH